jgi:hypothetical protein
LCLAAMTRANGMLQVAQIHESDCELVGLELLAGECCERLVHGVVRESLQSAGACFVRGSAVHLCGGCRQCNGQDRAEDADGVKRSFHGVAFNHGWTRMNTDKPVMNTMQEW